MGSDVNVKAASKKDGFSLPPTALRAHVRSTV